MRIIYKLEYQVMKTHRHNSAVGLFLLSLIWRVGKFASSCNYWWFECSEYWIFM